jgi:hypothetical protein
LARSLRDSHVGHAVLVVRPSLDRVEVVDPVEGKPGRFSRDEFERAWDGTVIRVDRGGDH